MIELPPAPREAWHTRGYYGSVSHNVKAIYQRYLGWFDGNPAHLWEHPPEASPRYVEFMGGVDAVVDKARVVRRGRLPLGAALLDHVVFADPGTRPPSCSRRHARAARLRRGERNLAQLLPHGRDRAARRQLRHAGGRRAASMAAQLLSSSSTRSRSGWTPRTPGTTSISVRLALHRPRRDVPHHAPQRRARARRGRFGCRDGGRHGHPVEAAAPVPPRRRPRERGRRRRG